MATTEAAIRTVMRNTLLDVVDHCPVALETIVRSLVARIKADQNRDACRVILQRLYRRLHDDADPVGRLHFHHWVIEHCQNDAAYPSNVNDEDAEGGREVTVT